MFNYGFIPQIKMVPTNTLIMAPFNPKTRTQKKLMAMLLAGIKELGGIVYPIVVSSDMRIIDGHRRYTLLKELGATEVPVIVVPLSLQQAYRILNTTQRKIPGREWAQAVAMGYFDENLPAAVRKDIEVVRELLGEEGVQMLVDNNMAPNVVGEAQTIAKYVDEIKGRTEKPTQERHRQVLRWLIVHKQQQAAKAAIGRQISPRLLRYAIESDTVLEGHTKR